MAVTLDKVLALRTELTKNGVPPSYEEIGGILGVTRQRIEQVIRPVVATLAPRKAALRQEKNRIVYEVIANWPDKIPPTRVDLIELIPGVNVSGVLNWLRDHNLIHEGHWLRPTTQDPFTEVDYFWARCDKTGGSDACHPWVGGTGHGGYGRLHWAGKARNAHTVAWELHTNLTAPKKGDGYHICHRCSNPSCCNPLHLYKGTAKQNSEDRDRAGRGLGQLTLEQVLDIRTQLQNNIPVKKIAAQYGVKKVCIENIKYDRTYKWAK